MKCENYWPTEVHEPKQYGEVVVDPVSISTMNKYNITIFQVSVVSSSNNFFTEIREPVMEEYWIKILGPVVQN